MTQVIRRRDPIGVLADHQTRIRRIEATPNTGGGGSGGADCARCDYVNPTDIFVPPALRDCVSVVGGQQDFVVTCNNSSISPLSPSMPAGYCGNLMLDTEMALQVRINTAMAVNIENLIVYAGVLEGQVYAVGWEPGESPATFDSGWVTVNANLCGADPCGSIITFSSTFSPHNTFAGSCVGPGTVAFRWVALTENEGFRGALDFIPQGDTFGDTVHFNSTTHEFVVGPRSVPARAMATFVGG